MDNATSFAPQYDTRVIPVGNMPRGQVCREKLASESANCAKSIRAQSFVAPCHSSSRFIVSVLGLQKSRPWFELNAANWDDIHRLAPIPQHDRVGFVGGDALDHAAPSGPVKHGWALVVVEHGCGAGGELHPPQSLDHFQSPSGKTAHIVTP